MSLQIRLDILTAFTCSAESVRFAYVSHHCQCSDLLMKAREIYFNNHSLCNLFYSHFSRQLRIHHTAYTPMIIIITPCSIKRNHFLFDITLAFCGRFSYSCTTGDRNEIITCNVLTTVERTAPEAEYISVAGPLVWNSLPDYLRDPEVSRDTFCRHLKTFLFAVY